jgi:hypothetical protein
MTEYLVEGLGKLLHDTVMIVVDVETILYDEKCK